MRQRQTKRTKQVAVSELDQALCAQEEAETLVKMAKKHVRKELVKSAVSDFKQTAEQRALIEQMFEDINPEKCKIYTCKESERLRTLCKIGFELTFYLYSEKYCLADYFTTIYDDELNWTFLFEYFKFLLCAFITQLHGKLSEHLDDLVPLNDILSEIKD